MTALSQAAGFQPAYAASGGESDPKIDGHRRAQLRYIKQVLPDVRPGADRR
jgi:hypothetical protein